MSREYNLLHRRKTGAKPKEALNRGCAGEHLVLSELLAKQLPVGVPVNPQTEHDMFVRIGKRWRTIQVKLGRLNTKTGYIARQNCERVSSDLIAAVDLEGKRVRWISNTDDPVPKELL